MSHSGQETSQQPTLAELLTNYLKRTPGLELSAAGEVIPYEAATVQPVDARLAWDEAVSAFGHFAPKSDPNACDMLPEWHTLVAASEPVTALPFCLGNFPQLVRDLHGLLHARKLSDLRPAPARVANGNSLIAFGRKAFEQQQYARYLLAVGLLRLTRHFDQAETLLGEHERDLPDFWRAAHSNELAALAWHRGRAEDARALWAGQEPNVPVLFNRGMAALFCEDIREAKDHLVRAVERLPDDNAWHHLGRLYLALAAMR